MTRFAPILLAELSNDTSKEVRSSFCSLIPMILLTLNDLTAVASTVDVRDSTGSIVSMPDDVTTIVEM